MNLQLATARLGVLLTAKALESGGAPSLTSSPRLELFSPSLRASWFPGKSLGFGFES